MRARLTVRARRHVNNAYHWYARQNLSAAQRWYEAMMRCLRGLAEKAEDCPLAPESPLFPIPLREITFGAGRRKSHRILFAIRPDMIVVYAVRHLAQDELDPETWDLTDDEDNA